MSLAGLYQASAVSNKTKWFVGKKFCTVFNIRTQEFLISSLNFFFLFQTLSFEETWFKPLYPDKYSSVSYCHNDKGASGQGDWSGDELEGCYSTLYNGKKSPDAPQQLKLVDLFESSTVVSMPESVLAVPSRQKTAEIMYSITNKT